MALFWIAVAVIAIIFAYRYFTWNFDAFKKMGVPGPKPLPVLGTSHLYMKKAYHSDLELKAKYGRTYGTFEGVNPVFVTSDVDLIKEITIKQFENFYNHQRLFINKAVRSSLMSLKNEQWRNARAAASGAFSASKLKQRTPIMDNAAQELINNLAIYAKTGEMFNVEEPCKLFTMDVIARTQFATELHSQKDPNNPFVLHSKKMIGAFRFFQIQSLLYMWLPCLLDIAHKLDICRRYPDDSVAFFKALIHKIINYRDSTNDRPADFLQQLLDIRKSKLEASGEMTSGKKIAFIEGEMPDLSDDDIAGANVSFLVAGAEAPATLIFMVLYCMAIYPDIQERLYQEIKKYFDENKEVTYEGIAKMKYLDQVVLETQRMHGAGTRTDRVCNKTCQVGQYVIPEGMKIEISIRAVHYDEEYWPDPYKFDPERFSPENQHRIVPNSFLPFGNGPHICLGMRIALLEAKLAVMRILASYEILRCEKTEVPLTYKRHEGTFPANGIWIRIKNRDRSPTIQSG